MDPVNLRAIAAYPEAEAGCGDHCLILPFGWLRFDPTLRRTCCGERSHGLCNGLLALLAANLAIAEDDPLLTGQALQADRAAGVNLVGRNADFRTQAIFESIGKACRCVDHD